MIEIIHMLLQILRQISLISVEVFTFLTWINIYCKHPLPAGMFHSIGYTFVLGMVLLMQDASILSAAANSDPLSKVMLLDISRKLTAPHFRSKSSMALTTVSAFLFGIFMMMDTL